MGNEVKGVQQEVIDHSHGCIEIPQYGTKHSSECIGYGGYCYLGFIQETEIITGLLISCQYIGFVGAIDPACCIYRSNKLVLYRYDERFYEQWFIFIINHFIHCKLMLYLLIYPFC